MGSVAQRIRRDVAAHTAAPRPVHGYKCTTCSKTTVVVQVDPGDVPDSIACRMTDRCTGRGSVGPYMGTAHPRWEWYRPLPEHRKDLRRRNPDLWAHVQRGGLLIRRRP